MSAGNGPHFVPAWPPVPVRRATLAGLITLVGLGGFIAATRPLFEDEIATLRLIRAFGPADITRVTAAWDVHPPLSYLLFDLLDDGRHDRWLMLPGLALGAAAAGWGVKLVAGSLGPVLLGTVVCGAFAVVYGALALLLRVPEATALLATLRRRLPG